MQSKKIHFSIILLILLLNSGCNKQINENIENENIQTNLIAEQNKNASINNSSNFFQTNSHEIKTENLRNISKIYLGCYSAGNSGATVMYISPKFIQTSNGKQKIRYVLSSADNKNKIYLLKLLQKDKSNFLQGYESISVNGEGINLEDYESEEDFKNGKTSGYLRFVKDDCKNILSILK